MCKAGGRCPPLTLSAIQCTLTSRLTSPQLKHSRAAHEKEGAEPGHAGNVRLRNVKDLASQLASGAHYHSAHLRCGSSRCMPLLPGTVRSADCRQPVPAVWAPTWCFFSGCSSRRRRSTEGSTNASVLPLPVHASTATSLFPQNRGMVASCGAGAPSSISRSAPAGTPPAGEPARNPPHLHRCGRLEALLLQHSQHLRAQPQACPAARHWAGCAALHGQRRRCAASGGSAGAAAKVRLRGPGWHTARLPRHDHLSQGAANSQVEAACRARDSGLCACAQRSEPRGAQLILSRLAATHAHYRK